MSCKAIALFFLFLTSCGYHLGNGAPFSPGSTISVPYVCGDDNGQFTREIIFALGRSGEMNYVSSRGTYLLEVSNFSIKEETVGYRYESNFEDVDGKRLVSSEGRLTMTAEVVLKRGNRCVLGPFHVMESVDFDFNPESAEQSETGFSMGQLDFEKVSRYEARCPLYRAMARKIVDYLNAGF